MTPADLYSRILPHVPNCPTPAVDQAVMDTAIEFADKTQIEFDIEAPIVLVNDQAEYSIVEAVGLRVSLVRHVYAPLWELDPVTPSQLQDRLRDWQSATSSDPVAYKAWPDPNVLTVYPTPRNVTGQTLRVIASWKPARNAAAFADRLGEDYMDPLVAGALARLMRMPDQKWTNFQLAGLHQTTFNDGVVEARADAIHAKAAGSLRVRPRQFGQ